MRIRMARPLTQTQLADQLKSTQRNTSRYDTAECPRGPVIVQPAKVLQASADQLLGLQPPKAPAEPKNDPETKRLWKRFQPLLDLPEKDRRAVIRSINSLEGAGERKAG